MTDRSVEDRLTAAFGAGMTPAQQAWVDERVDATLTQQAQRPRRRPRLTRSLLLVGALLILAPTVLVVGATIMSTEAPYGLRDAAAYEAELQAAKAVTPIPPGATWPPYLETAPDPNAAYGAGLGTQMVEGNAFCLWLGYWYDGNERGDTTATAAAIEVLEAARGWTTFTDPLLSDETFRTIHRATIDAVIAADAPTVLRHLELNCDGTWGASK